MQSVKGSKQLYTCAVCEIFRDVAFFFSDSSSSLAFSMFHSHAIIALIDSLIGHR